MTGAEIAFVVIGVAAVVGAFRVVTARNVVRAALYLVITLSAVAGVYLLLGAEFVAWVQILIYVGAIVILFLFGLMLTKAPIGREALDNQRRGVAFLVALAILGGPDLPDPGGVRLGRGPHRPGGGLGGRGRVVDLQPVRPAVRGDLVPAAGGADRGDRPVEEGRPPVIRLPLVLFLSAALFSTGVYGVLARRNAVLVLMSIELMLNAVNINLVAFGAALHDLTGQVFALFVITVAAAEVGIGLAIVILIYRNRATINVDEVNLLKW